MAKVTIDGKEYETDNMSEDARRQLGNVATCDRKLEELRNETAMIQTARNAYARSLTDMLSKEE
jgi:cell division protein ZapA (FtsZ GTPase activity inhibitor)